MGGAIPQFLHTSSLRARGRHYIHLCFIVRRTDSDI